MVRSTSILPDRRILVVLASVFTVMLGVGVVSPILPTYAESFGVSHTLMGIFMASFGVARLVMDLPSGQVSDRYGRKPMMMIGLAVFLLSGLVAGFAYNFGILLVARVLQGVGASIFTSASTAYVADIAPRTERAHYMGQFQGSFFLGTAAGPAVGGVLTDIGGARIPFFILSALSLISLVLIYRFVSAEEMGAMNTKFDLREIAYTVKKTLGGRSGLVLGVTSFVLFITTSGVRLTAIPIFGKLALGMSELEIGLVISLIATINFLGTFFLGSWADQWGRRRALILSFALTGVSIGAYGMVVDFGSMVAVSIVFGLGTSIILPVQYALLVDHSDPERRGLSLGAYRLFNDLGIVGGPLLTGFLFDAFSLTAPFIVISAICLATALMTLKLREMPFR